MGLYTVIDCPICKTSGARKFLWIIKCPRRGCPKYNRALDDHLRELDLARMHRSSKATPQKATRRARATAGRPSVPPDSDPIEILADGPPPGEELVPIRYTNRLGEDRTFMAEAASIRNRGTFISARITPTGRRCSFRRNRITNIAELKPRIDAEALLNNTDRQILGYHRKHGTTSASHEAVKRKLSAR